MAELTEDQKKIKALSEENETLKTANAAQKLELETASTVVTDLKAKLAEKEASTVTLPTVKVGEYTYELTSSFTFATQEITIDVLKADSELAEKIVKRGIANLRKVEKKKA